MRVETNAKPDVGFGAAESVPRYPGATSNTSLVPATSSKDPDSATIFPETRIVPPGNTEPVRKFWAFGVRTVVPCADKTLWGPRSTVGNACC